KHEMIGRRRAERPGKRSGTGRVDGVDRHVQSHSCRPAHGNAPSGERFQQQTVTTAARSARNHAGGEPFSRHSTSSPRKERYMNWDRIEGNWKQFKGKVQQEWGSLTDDDLDRINGRQTELTGILQERYGKSRE